METEQFSLSWSNFQSNLTAGFNLLFQEEDLVDVTLAAEGRYLKAHKAVLSVCSPYFKELFRVNPCKHPIVILPSEVSYHIMSCLLTYMYQGEVSVRQEEIPMFLKIAEVLRIKGLTEKQYNESNGFETISSRHSTSSSTKRKSTVKKHIKPTHSLVPMDRPMLSPHSTPPPIKQARLEESSQSGSEHEAFAIPKPEPSDHDTDYLAENSYDDSMPVDMSSMLDTTLGETSDSGTSMYRLDRKTPIHDVSSPGGGLLVLKSRKGHPVLIHNGHIYALHQKRDNKSTWLCVKQRTLNCEGCVTTTNGPTLLSYSGHNHAQLHDVIQRLQASSCTPSPELL